MNSIEKIAAKVRLLLCFDNSLRFFLVSLSDCVPLPRFFANRNIMSFSVFKRYACLLLVLVSVLWSPALSAQDEVTAQQPLTTAGTDFWVAFPRIIGTPKDDASLLIHIMVTGNEAVDIIVENAVTGNRYGTLSIGEGGGYKELKIAPDGVYLEQSERVQQSVHVYARDGKTAFSCFAQVESGAAGSSARDATLMLPRKSLGYEYMVQTYPQDGKSTEFVLVATEDNTSVVVTPTTTTFGGKAAGAPITYTLRRGQSVMIASKQKEENSSDTLDMSGSLICADHPIAVYGANEALKIPMNEGLSDDYTFEQIPPISSMGTRFYVARPKTQVQNMLCCVTALFDNTVVNEYRYNANTKKIVHVPTTLQAGQSLAVRPPLNRIISDIVIETSLPALCYTYFTSAANNQEEGFDEDGNSVVTIWGDPANTMVTAWEQRVKDMTFFIRPLMTQLDTDEQSHYVQVTVPKNEIGLLRLDGAPVDASLFKTYGYDTEMAYATLPVSGYGRQHSLTTEGDGFVGYVYGISEGVAYLYTLGFRPDAHPDSLFINETRELMSPDSYDLERFPQGWYQRQLIDWPENEQRLDTAIVCDSSLVHFALQSDRAYVGFVWEVWQLENGKADSLISQETVVSKDPVQNWQHQFFLPDQRDRAPKQRDPYTEFIVYAMMQRARILCPEDNPLTDTLRTVVRVMRSYNDTVQRIICSVDTARFFFDSVYVDAPALSYTGLYANRDSTRFVADTVACARGRHINSGDHEIKIGLGEHYFTRHYESRSGCDSTITFAVYVCPSPDTTWVDTLLLHNRTELTFPEEENTMFAGQTINRPGVYMDHLIASHCACPNIVDTNFVGCDSVIVMRVQLRDTLVVNFCDSTANPTLYKVNWNEFDWTGHSAFPNIADSVAVGQTREFHDYYKTADGMDSCYTLILTRDPVTVVETIVDWPNNRPYVWKYGEQTMTIEPDRSWLDVTIVRDRRVTYENGDCPMLFHLEVTFKETYFTIREVDICDVDTAMWRGHIIAGDKWTETYPTATFKPERILPAGNYEICVDSFRTVVPPERDSLYYFQVNIHPTYHEYDTIHICDNEVLDYNGKYFAGYKAVTSQPLRHRLKEGENIYRFDSVYITRFGCDSVCSAVFYQHPSYQMPVEQVTICADSDFVWAGHSDSERPLYDATTGKAVAFGKGKLWRNSTNTTFTLIDSLRTLGCADCQHGGCDSIHTLQLTVNPVYGPIVVDTTVCRSRYNFEWVGHPDKNRPGQNLVFATDTFGYYDTLHTVGCGCDSVFVLNLRFFDDAPRVYDTAVCHNAEPFLMGTTGEFFHPSDSTLGLHIVTRDVYLSEAQHCPYIETWNVTVYPDYSGMTNPSYCLYDTICRDTTGNYYVWDNHDVPPIDITRAGDYLFYDSLTTTTCYDCAHGCDSVWVLRLTVLPSYYHEFRHMMSDEETYHWEEVTYGGINTRTAFDKLVVASDTLIESHHNLTTGTYTCDSTVKLYLRVGKVYRDTTYDFVCNDCYYTWYRNIDGKDSLMADSVQVPAGDTLVLADRYLTTLGFDSVYYLALVGMPTYDLIHTDTVCQFTGDYDWQGHFGSLNHLYRNGQPITNIALQDTGWVVVTDSMLTQRMFVDPNGMNTRMTLCDSVWTLRLYVAPVYDDVFHTAEVTTNDVLCSNETYLWERTLMVGHDFDHEAVSLPASSILYDSLILLTPDMYDAAGIFHFRHDSTTVLGCDSIRFLHLQVPSMQFTMRYDTIGDNNTTWSFGHGVNRVTGYDFHVDDYTVVRDVRRYFFIDTLLTANGCDSIVHDSLLVVPSYRFEESAVTCSGVTFNWRKYTELNREKSGYYYDSLYTTAYGADSTYVLYLTIVPNFHSEQTKQMCKNDTLWWHYKKIFYESWNEGDLATTYHVEYVRPGACDSLYDMHMYYYDYYHIAADTDSVCQYQPYRWYGKDGIEHIRALRDEQGNILTAVPTDTVGWITIYDSLHTSSPCQCDSTFMLRLYVQPAYYYRDTVVICSNDTLNWHGRTYSSPVATILRDTIPLGTDLGCDSIYYLHVQVDQAYFFDETDVICASQLPYSWAGHTDRITIPATTALLWEQDSVFVLWDSCQTVLGCDSIYRRRVTVKPIRHIVIRDTICHGDTLQYHWHRLTQPGTYTDTLVNQWGCDSIVTLILHLVPPTQFRIDEMPVLCGDESSFDVTFTVSGIEPVAFTLRYGEKALEQRFTDLEWTDLANGQRTITLSLPLPESDTDYPEPNDYKATLYFDNGYCLDSTLLALPLSFRLLYPSWLLEQHWDDAIGLLTDSLNGGYRFVGFQWYKDNVLLPGETKPYLYCPQYLDAGAAYSVALTRQTDSLTFMTCPIVPDLSRPQSLTPTQPYISVVPTLVVRENPVVNILCVNSGQYEIYDAYGVQLSTGYYFPGAHNAFEVTLPAASGVYIFHLHDAAMLERTVKVIVQ